MLLSQGATALGTESANLNDTLDSTCLISALEALSGASQARQNGLQTKPHYVEVRRADALDNYERNQEK
jgi:hypothetical protein